MAYQSRGADAISAGAIATRLGSTGDSSRNTFRFADGAGIAAITGRSIGDGDSLRPNSNETNVKRGDAKSTRVNSEAAKLAWMIRTRSAGSLQIRTARAPSNRMSVLAAALCSSHVKRIGTMSDSG